MKAQRNKTCTTEHARKRLQQRAINNDMVRLIEEFGRYSYQKGGAHIASIPEKRITEIRRALDRISGVQLVIGDSETVITAMRQHRKTRTTQYVA